LTRLLAADPSFSGERVYLGLFTGFQLDRSRYYTIMGIDSKKGDTMPDLTENEFIAIEEAIHAIAGWPLR